MQQGPEFIIEEVDNLDADAQALLTVKPDADSATYILGKDLPLEQTIANMSGLLAGLGIKIEIASWRNIILMWVLHIRDAHSPMCFTNGKGATKKVHSLLRSANTLSVSAIITSMLARTGVRISPMPSLFITPTRNGSSLERKTPCPKKFWMNTA